tara:strand:+ start:97 stop:441 length:345 start_codon:yes stop_codon:yes gene_type:complete
MKNFKTILILICSILSFNSYASEIFLNCIAEGTQTLQLNIDRENNTASQTWIQDDGSGVVSDLGMKTTPKEYLFTSRSNMSFSLNRENLVLTEDFFGLLTIRQCSIIETKKNQI